MIRIRKLDPADTPWFRRRWVASREPDDDGVADHLIGYFYSQQEAIEYLEYPIGILDVTGLPAGGAA